MADYTSYRDQGFARQLADWLVGINLTRLISLKSSKLLHFGRVQTAVLGAVYVREQEIKNFAKEKYVEVKAVLDVGYPVTVKLVNSGNEDFPFRFVENSPLLKEITANISAMKTGVINNIEKEKKTVHPPQLFNLTALQKEAHKKFSYAPEQTLDLAQALYEKHKCLSYPRTPSRVMGDDNVKLIKDIYEKLDKDLHKKKQEIPGIDPLLMSGDNKRLFNSAELQDHHALIPLAPLPAGCSDAERDIYSLVFDRFFTILKPPYVYNAISIDAGISGYTFKGNGIEVLNMGWKSGTAEDEDDEKQEDYSSLEQGKSYPVSSVEPVEKYTEPKKRYTFASLLQLMENPRGIDGVHLTGIGTPATRGAILQKLVDRKYVLLKGKNIIISDDGNFLLENIGKSDALASFISIPETTKWEEQLHENVEAFIDGIKNFVRDVVANTEIGAYVQEKKSPANAPSATGMYTKARKISTAAITNRKNHARLLSGKKSAGPQFPLPMHRLCSPANRQR